MEVPSGGAHSYALSEENSSTNQKGRTTSRAGVGEPSIMGVEKKSNILGEEGMET